MLQDFRYAVRGLLKDARLTAIVVACLALGIGVNATLFAVVDGVLIQPLPFSHPERLVVLNETFERGGVREAGVSYPNLIDWKAASSSFTAIAGISGRSFTLSDGGGEPERVRGAATSWELFTMLAVPPAIGRHLGPADDRPGAEPVVILNDTLWRRRYLADPAIVGKPITINGRPHTVVAVMGPGFSFPENEQLWVPLGPIVANDARSTRGLFVIGRLADGITLTQARTELAGVATQLATEHPGTSDGWSAIARPISDEFIPDDVRLILWTMMGAVTLVLLIACANVANLMLSRASARQREFSVRAALGAGRGRMIRQLLTECVVLGLAAAPIGLLLAWVGVELLNGAVPRDQVPYYIHWAIDGRAIGYTVVVSILTGMLFGLAPAAQASRLSLVEALRDGARGSGTSGRRARLRHGLVIVEIALALVLLVGASLFIRSFFNLQSASPGFDTSQLLAMRFYLAGDDYSAELSRVQRVEDVVQRIQALPGVVSVVASNFIPFDGGGGGGNAIVEGRSVERGEEPAIGFTAVTPQLHRTLGLGLIKGRDFTDAEGRSRTPVAIIDETMAARLWPDADPIGKRFRLTEGPEDWFTIVGVAPVFQRYDMEDDAPPPQAFVPYPYAPTFNTGLTIRVAAGSPTALAPAAREQIRAADPALAVFAVRPLEEARTRSFWQFRLFGQMFAVFGAVALVLAAIGVYGVLSFAVSQRTQEIGLRMALGAEQADVRLMIVRQGVTLAAIGIVVGLVGAFGITRVVSSLLFNVTATDPVSFGGVALFLTIVAIAASYVPARRATTVDPIVALRID